MDDTRMSDELLAELEAHGEPPGQGSSLSFQRNLVQRLARELVAARAALARLGGGGRKTARRRTTARRA